MRTTTPRGRFQRSDLHGLSVDASDWRADAACLDSDPELWFAAGNNWHPTAVEQARLICRTWPVAGPCLDDALTANDQHAIRGGTTPEERRLMRRQRHLAEMERELGIGEWS